MANEPVCPDCGGVIGGKFDLDTGSYPCRCDEATVDEHYGEVAGAMATQIEARSQAKKVCVNCGKDLTGHTRFKDSLGYWCKDCHKTDKKLNEGVKCAACGRKFPEEKLIEFEGKKRCVSCEKERQQKVLAKLRKAGREARYEKAEFETVKWLSIAAAVILALIVIVKLISMLRHH